ncbi:MAG: hypothetical protein JWO78_1856 [Micavibrio sp.]|nr:hypothetical protein [Micavibrio sp.]
MKRTNLLLFLVIFLEGYAVLSTELLAIRQVMPFVGSGADTISIIIAAVLMPLAFGYALGGSYVPHTDRQGQKQTIRKRLLLNLSVSAIILAIGLSHATTSLFFSTLIQTTQITSKPVVTTLYAAVFIVLPVFLLGQTVPLISNYFRRQHLSTFAGRILFLSTMGSFAGSVLCTLVLMPHIGVHMTVVVTIACLALLTLLLSRNPINPQVALVCAALLLTLGLNSKFVFERMHIVADDQYMTVEVFNPKKKNGTEDESMRIFKINSTWASGLYTDKTKADNLFPPLDYIEKQFIYSRPESTPPIYILMIGAGGFTLGLKDKKNHYTYIDINPDLQRIAEAHFLKEKIGPNKKFVPEEARAFLAYTKEKYDLVILDPYQDASGIPLGLVTTEFFNAVNGVLKPGGIMTGNFYIAVNFSDEFSIRLDNTIRTVFPNLNRQALTGYKGWQQDKAQYQNVIYSAFKNGIGVEGVYTDDLNRSFLDKNKVP